MSLAGVLRVVNRGRVRVDLLRGCAHHISGLHAHDGSVIHVWL